MMQDTHTGDILLFCLLTPSFLDILCFLGSAYYNFKEQRQHIKVVIVIVIVIVILIVILKVILSNLLAVTM